MSVITYMLSMNWKSIKYNYFEIYTPCYPINTMIVLFFQEEVTSPAITSPPIFTLETEQEDYIPPEEDPASEPMDVSDRDWLEYILSLVN